MIPAYPLPAAATTLPGAADATRPAAFHLPSLDGLRAISVAIVFVSHLGLSHIVPGGFGVTVFFFLSGFLITTLLRREFESKGSISFRGFYLRRAYRILPPMYLTFLFALAVSTSGLVHTELDWRAVLMQLAHLTNYIHLVVPDGDDHLPVGTSIFWSLAVEEHFYLVYPLLCLALLRARAKGRAFWVLIASCAVVLAWRYVLVLGFDVDSIRTYRGTDTRVDSLLYGCILALCFNPALDYDRSAPRSDLKDGLLLAVSLGVLLFCFVYRDEAFRETARYTLQGIALMPIFWLAILRADWFVFSWLEWAPIRWIGLLSYTIYLSQLTIASVVHALMPKGSSALLHASLTVALTLVYAAAMYRWVELPCARLRARLHQ
jgi:peptidoglycan/LPS O-acetylase OafA/YrhL